MKILIDSGASVGNRTMIGEFMFVCVCVCVCTCACVCTVSHAELLNISVS